MSKLLTKSNLLHVDLFAGVGSATYAAIVAGVEPLAYLGEVFASPQAAAAFAMVAFGRWYANVRNPA